MTVRKRTCGWLKELKDSEAVTALSVIGVLFGLIGMLGPTDAGIIIGLPQPFTTKNHAPLWNMRV